MKKIIANPGFILLVCILFTGCGPVGEKNTSLSIIYCVAAVLSLLLLIGYCRLAHPKDVWFLLLFSSVLVVNIGYLTLSISKTLE